MKKLFTNLKVAMTLLLLCGVCSAWAETVTFDPTQLTSNVAAYASGPTEYTQGGHTWTLAGYSVTANTSVGIGKGGANYLQTPILSGNITSVTVTWTGNTSYYLTLQTVAGVELEAKKNTSESQTYKFSVEGNYSQLRLVARRSSSTSNALATITKVVVEYSTTSKTLESIAVSGTPTKTAYDTGGTFDPAGLTVTGTYSDTSTDDLTDEAEWTFAPATFTSTSQTSVSVTATVDGKSDTKVYAVTVAEHVITPGTYEISLNNALYGIDAGASGTEQSVTKNDITIVSGCSSNASNKTYYDTNHIRYYANSYLKLSVPEGYEITQIIFTADGTWNDSGIKTEVGTYNSSTKTWTGSSSAVDFSFTAQCRAASIKVTYAKAQVKTLKAISVSGQKESFYKGDKFEFGGTVTASYEEDEVDDEVVTGQATFEGYDMSNAGTQTVTVKYNEKQTTYQITVNTIANTLGTAYTTEKAIELIDAGKDLASEVYVKGRISEIVKFESGQITYWLDDKTFQVYHGKNLGNVSFTSVDDIEVGADVVVYGKIKKYSSTYEFDEGNYLASYSEPTKTGATIELTTYQTKMKAGEEDEYEITYDGDGELSITSSDESVAEAIIVDNTVLIEAKANGSTTITISAPETDNYFSASMTYTLKVVGPASLPFAYEGGRDNMPTGMTQTGLGTDYSSSPKLKFDSAGDNLIIWFGEQAGYVSYNIKGNGGSGVDWSGKFDVMESADGVEYTTVASYTVIESTTTAKGNALKSDSRYVKFVYTTKTNGNVALGNICINKPVTISDAGWATAYVPFNATVSENATAYYVTGTSGETLVKKPVTVIKAGEGVLLKSNNGEATTVTFTASTETADDASENLMKGSLTEKTFNDANTKYYILANGEEGLGFYYQGKDNTTGASATCAAGKAVLAIPTGSSAKAFFSLFDDATGIKEINNAEKQDAQYNLNGVRVNGNYKGIVIINGKKVVK